MPAFNYRQLISQIPPRTWQFCFQLKNLPWPEILDPHAPDEGWVDAVRAELEGLPEEVQRGLYRDLRRVHGVGHRRGIQALRNSVPLGAPMLDDFEHHTSDAERALWALLNWPEDFAHAEAFLNADAKIGYRTWKRLHLEPPLTLYTAPDDQDALRQALSRAFTPRKARKTGKVRECEIDVLTRHLDGAIQIDLRVEDDPQRQQEFGPDGKTLWRDLRPPVYLTVLIYPEHGVIDLLVPGGESARKKVIEAVGQHVLRQHIEPLDRPPPLFLLNRLRDGLVIDADRGLDLLAHGVEALRLSECKVRSMFPPTCTYLIKPPGGKEVPDALVCLKSHKTSVLIGPGFNIVEAVLSVYFFPDGQDQNGRVLHLDLRPGGISHLNALEDRCPPRGGLGGRFGDRSEASDRNPLRRSET